MEASKYILKNIADDEELRCIVSSSKGLFNSNPDIAITSKRIFARYSDGKSFSFPLSKIKNIEIVPNKGLFGREKESGVINVIGPYNKVIKIVTNNLNETNRLIRKNISQ